jgi:hypothetical protein
MSDKFVRCIYLPLSFRLLRKESLVVLLKSTVIFT